MQYTFRKINVLRIVCFNQCHITSNHMMLLDRNPNIPPVYEIIL
nr:MAG TPA: hypothetical protein [Caudoviricetes sp.]